MVKQPLNLAGKLRTKAAPAATSSFGPPPKATPQAEQPLPQQPLRTGQVVRADQPTVNVPPPSRLPGMPLPLGRPMRVERMTDEEEAIFRPLGWNPGDPLPDNMAEIIAAVQEEATNIHQLPPPVAMDTPPLKLPPETPLDKLSPKAQAAIMAAIKETKRIAAEGDGPPIPDSVARAARGIADQEIEIVDDREEADEYKPGEATGVRQEQRDCPHCGWDQSLTDGTNPTATDKLSFLQSILGDKPYVRRYSLLGNSLHVTFRTLSPSESDACWTQTRIEDRKGEFGSPGEAFERVGRYRVSLQLQQIEADSFTHDLPENLEDWRKVLSASGYEAEAGETLLPLVREAVFTQVLTSESIGRIVGRKCEEFNRLVEKLEANVDNPGFWEATPVAP